MAADGPFRIGIDVDRHRLSGPHNVELSLLEVRRDPDLVGYEHREIRANLCKFTGAAAELDDTPRLVRRNRRVGQVQLRLVALGLCLIEARDRAVALRLEGVDLPLRQLESRLRILKRGL